MSSGLWVVAVPVIVWAGVFLYVLTLDRKVAAIEVRHDEDER